LIQTSAGAVFKSGRDIPFRVSLTKRYASSRQTSTAIWTIAHPGAVSLVQLGNKMMPTAFGLRPRPDFKIVGWRNKKQCSGGPAPNANRFRAEKPTEIEPPFNDQIPSFNHEDRQANTPTALRPPRRRARVSSDQKVCCRMQAAMARREDRAAAERSGPPQGADAPPPNQNLHQKGPNHVSGI
jgi:hypothetical protein